MGSIGCRFCSGMCEVRGATGATATLPLIAVWKDPVSRRAAADPQGVAWLNEKKRPGMTAMLSQGGKGQHRDSSLWWRHERVPFYPLAKLIIALL